MLDAPLARAAMLTSTKRVLLIEDNPDLAFGLRTSLEIEGYDVVQAETDEALRLTGKDVGTPILHFEPPGGVAFFGPVISRLPDDADALEDRAHRGAARRSSGSRIGLRCRWPPQPSTST